MDQVPFLQSCSFLCLALALAASCSTSFLGNRPNNGTSTVVAASCLWFCPAMWHLPYYAVVGITMAAVGVSLSSLQSSISSLFHQKQKSTTLPAASLLWKVVGAMLKRGEFVQAIICLIWGMHCFITHVLLELEDLVLELVPQWEGEVVVILGHPRSASTHVHHMLSQTLPSSASLTFYDVLFPSLIQWYCMYPFKPLVNTFLRLLDSPQHRIAVDEVAEEQQWLLLKFKDILLPMLFPAMVDDPELFRASCDYTEADMMFIKGCMRRLLIRKPQSKLYIARMLTFSPWPEYITAASRRKVHRLLERYRRVSAILRKPRSCSLWRQPEHTTLQEVGAELCRHPHSRYRSRPAAPCGRPGACRVGDASELQKLESRDSVLADLAAERAGDARRDEGPGGRGSEGGATREAQEQPGLDRLPRGSCHRRLGH
ncbi:PLSCR2 [Symbiodinium necroappetens]|uniref:PLSCR2 protein n=1 Tax=Symbiodinium necroappetens TaxID=1628268 RepID=A0A812LU34_9DINO|nr:PLSCR2 [Symbiodinium necroappetens]